MAGKIMSQADLPPEPNGVTGGRLSGRKSRVCLGHLMCHTSTHASLKSGFVRCYPNTCRGSDLNVAFPETRSLSPSPRQLAIQTQSLAVQRQRRLH